MSDQATPGTDTPVTNPAIDALIEKWRQFKLNAEWYDKKHLPKLKSGLERETTAYRNALKDRDSEVNDMAMMEKAIVALGGQVPDE